MPIRGGKAYRQNWKVKEFIRQRDGGKCQVCGCRIGGLCNLHPCSEVQQMDVAHIKLWDHSLQSSSFANLQLQCHPCNIRDRGERRPGRALPYDEWIQCIEAYALRQTP